MRARLLLAFFGIAAFAVVAAAAGIYAFREVGGRLDVVDARIPTTLSALELSRSAERIIAAAPALLAATERTRRDEVKAELAAEIERLNGKLRELEQERAQALPLGRIEPLVSSLTANLADLENLVARRLEASQRIATLRRGVFQTNDETQRLLAPWLEVVGSEIDALVEARNATPRGRGDQAPRLASLIELQALMQSAQAEVSAVADMLAEASTTDEPSRLRILVFQLDLALRDLESTAAGLDPKLRPLFLEQVAKLRAFTDGANAIAKAREQELALVGEGRELLAGTRRLSAQLTHAVDELGSAAKGDIGEAIRAALSVQQLSTHALVVVVAMSLVTSVLIVWLYVGRNIVRRLTALSDSMLAIAGGRLDAPVAVKGADEIAAMARAVEVFRRNTLERDGFEIANKYKSHVLASASHDLRQPLHALNLFVAQLRAESDPEERKRLVPRINAAVSSMNELFDALLDMSKLDAGVLQPNPSEFPIEPLLTRMETTFADTAREKGLRLSVVTSSAWVRSDFVLLERILLNLVSNAVRYTKHGGVVVGCRRRGGELRIDVCDSGPGIPKEQQRKIFGEFVQLGAASSERRGGLGLGLSIIDRLARLLEHPLEVNSRVGGGSRFSITVPLAVPRSESTEAPASIAPVTDPARGKRIVVIDDDALVLDGMADVLRSWGCEVVTAGSGEAALAELTAQRHKPDLIISDYRLADGKTGIDAIERLRGEWGAAIPAFLISGDTAPERLREASASGYHLLHKPVTPLRLRAMVNQLLKGHEAADGAGPPIRRPAAARRPASWPR
ncbi:MAG: response regulator [Gammaproteobacteria bacterium]|nr:response regulator [Gammaproteobacteria bacterium]NIR89105.1 response regulator [Gammaproteobacteria bacterium]NIU06550.1 response regulator [Gammaproteobacteria bacterium]NIV53439.1 response regulator [Gammaproteobacteria bacterium]NIX87823.1 response regulator [Gammaproteobacteria bacterium]